MYFNYFIIIYIFYTYIFYTDTKFFVVKYFESYYPCENIDVLRCDTLQCKNYKTYSRIYCPAEIKCDMASTGSEIFHSRKRPIPATTTAMLNVTNVQYLTSG